MNKKIIVQFFLGLFFVFAALAQNNTSTNNWEKGFKHEKVFIENQGQFDGLNESSEPVLFASDYDHAQFLFTAKGLCYRLTENKAPNKHQREEIEKRMHKLQAAGQPITHEDIEREEHRTIFTKDIIQVEWLNANPTPKIIVEDEVSHYYTYTLKKGALDHVKAFKKIIYKELYPNIDVVYEFHPQNGIEYSFIVRPGADMNLVKAQYDGAKKIMLNKLNGSITITTKFGDIVEHAPSTFYKNNPSIIIPSAFVQNENVLSFSIADYDKNAEIVVDPWIQTPAFNTQWDCVWECEKDGAGNAYIIGGTVPMQLLKYNAAGALQWTHSTPYDTSSWLGTFATDNAGNSYVTLGSVAQIEKVNTSGAQVWSNTSPGGLLGNTEFWNIAFNCDQTKLIIGGTGGALLNIVPYIYDVDMASGNVTASVRVTGGALFPTQEVRSITACGNGKYYFLTHDSIGYIQQNLNLCSSVSSTPFHVSNGYSFGYKCENWRLNNTGIMAIRYYNGFIYTTRGTQLHKRNFATGAIIATATIPGGGWASSQVKNAGIDIDNCGNIFVGSVNQVVKFDANLNQLAIYPTTSSYNVYDVAVSSSGNIIACGSNGTSSSGPRQGYVESIAAGACATIALTCCDASICQVPPKCTTDGNVTLIVSTPGGTFSGTGVNPTTGVFSPATAGVGSHTIVYTLPCGTDSIVIVVNNCSSTSVCKETNGNLTVSGGTPTYTWSYWQPATSTPITTQAQCTACGYTWFFGSCLNGVVPVTSCNSPAQWVTFGTGTTVTPPVGKDTLRVVDNAGTVYLINGIANVPPCSACPTISIALSNQINVKCNGGTTGSFTATASGGVSPYNYVLKNGATTVATFNSVSGGQSITGLAIGTYTINVTDNNGCTGTNTITITQPAALSVSIASTTPATCGLNNGGATTTVTGGVTTYTYAWNNGGGTGANIASMAAGTYIVTVTDANACTATTTATITATSSITTNMTATPTGCGTPSGKAKVTITAGTGPFTYLWSNGQTADSATNLAAGMVYVTVTGAGGCTKVDSIMITTTITPPTANAGLDTTLTCITTSVTIGTAATVGYNYAWSPSAGLSATNIAQPTATVSGTYTVTVTNTINGCTASDQVVVTQNITAPNVNAGLDKTLTCASSSVTLNGSSSTPGVTFSWSSGLGTNATATATSVGTYTLTVRNPVNGCTASDNVVVSPDASLPNISAMPDTSLTCTRTSVSYTASSTTPGVTYLWSNNGGVLGANATFTTAGVYTVTVTNTANSCTVSETVDVTQNITAPIANAGLDATLTCTTTSTTIGTAAIVGNTYAWSPSAGLSATNIAQPTANATGTYTVTVTNTANGCTASDQVVISQNITPPTANAGLDATLTCTTTSTTIGTTAIVGNTYAWSPSAGLSATNIAQPTANATGTYTVTVMNTANGCTASDQVVISQDITPPTANAGLDATLTCTTTSTTIGTAAIVGNTYVWSPAAGLSATNIAQPTANAAGTYTVTVTNTANGCTASDQVIISQNITPPTANAGLDATLTCATPSTTIGTAAIVGNTYAWSPSAGLSATNIAQPTVTASGSYTVTVTNTTNGCTASDVVIISSNISIPNVDAGTDQTLSCTSSNATLNGSSTTSGVTFNWSGPSIVSGGNTATAIVNTAGNYILVVTNPTNGCTASDTVVVTPNTNTPNIDAGLDQVLTCIKLSATLVATSTTPNVTFSWSNSTLGNTTTVNSPNTYFVTATNSINGCIAIDQVVVTQNITPPNVNAGLDKTLTCTINSVQLNGSSTTAGATFAWSNGLGNLATATATLAGTYTITATDPTNGCTASDNVDVINGVQNITTSIVGVDPNCHDETNGNATAQVAGGTAPYSYVWSSVPTGGNTATIQNLGAPQTISVTVTDANGCTSTANTVLSNPAAPILILLPQDTSVEFGATIQLNATLQNFSAQNYTWNPTGLSCNNCSNPIVNPTAENTIYAVTVSYNNSCSVSAQAVVHTQSNNQVYVPNAFTPNNDDMNDYFNVFVSNYKTFSLSIYNRWGEKVYEGSVPENIHSNTTRTGWDGTYKKAMQPNEVYVYYTTVVFLNGEVKHLKGSMTLIR